jgi:hypothetical protein
MDATAAYAALHTNSFTFCKTHAKQLGIQVE